MTARISLILEKRSVIDRAYRQIARGDADLHDVILQRHRA